MSNDTLDFIQQGGATLLIGFLVWEAMQVGYPVTSALGMIALGLINGVTAGEFVSNFRQAQRESRTARTPEEDPREDRG